MANPVLIELTRGALVESMHAGVVAIAHADGRIVGSIGDIGRPVYPRSAVKPLQALPFLESGAAERFGFGAPEIAIACASHAGTPRHASLVAAMLAAAGLTPAALGCGVHEPFDAATAHALIRAGSAPSALHHNCSGKHAAMLATAVHMGGPTGGSWRPDHPGRRRGRAALEALTGSRLEPGVCGIDGCSVPNWAIPPAGLAAAFARLASGAGLPPDRARAAARIVQACMGEPDMVGGPGRLDTVMMARLRGKVLMKGGAEGAYCGALPERGLGFALKIDDGAKRGAEAAVAALVARFYAQAHAAAPDTRLRNWRGLEVGEVRPSAPFAALLETLA